RIRTTGGGGWGDPLDRDVDAVLRDVVWGKVSIGAADRDYGVILTGTDGEVVDGEAAAGPDLDALTVDHAATQVRREQLREDRGEVVPFFDRGPGYAQLAPDGAAYPDVDVR